MGYRYRLYRKDLPGKPDLVFPKYKKVIFVHGCFWHGHNRCSRGKMPETNRKFWENKIKKNKERDKAHYKELKRIQWEYLIIWQCEIKEKEKKQLRERIKNYLEDL